MEELICFRCGEIIKVGERMINVEVAEEVQLDDGSISIIGTAQMISMCHRKCSPIRIVED